MGLLKNILLLFFVSVGLALQQVAEESSADSNKLSGSVLNGKIEEFTSLLNEVRPVLSMIQSTHAELTDVQNDILTTSDALERSRRSIRETLDKVPERCVGAEEISNSTTGGCSVISNDASSLMQLGYNASVVGFTIVKDAMEITAEVQSCPSINIYKAYRCYVLSVEAMGDLIKYVRNEGYPIMQNALLLTKQLLADLQNCLSSSKSTQQKLYQHINSC